MKYLKMSLLTMALLSTVHAYADNTQICVKDSGSPPVLSLGQLVLNASSKGATLCAPATGGGICSAPTFINTIALNVNGNAEQLTITLPALTNATDMYQVSLYSLNKAPLPDQYNCIPAGGKYYCISVLAEAQGCTV